MMQRTATGRKRQPRGAAAVRTDGGAAVPARGGRRGELAALSGVRRPRRTGSLLLAVLVFAAYAAVAPAAKGQERPIDERSMSPQQAGAGSLLFRMQSGYSTATRINTEIDMRISGPVARTAVRQTFRNDGNEWVEGIYVFPLPDKAAVDRLRMRVGERLVEGEVREKEQARAEYAKARADGNRSALVEQERSNLFTTHLANLGPGETVIVEIEYFELLQYDDREFRLRFPLTLTPRYIPGSALPDRQGSGWSPDTTEVSDASRITPPQLPQPAGDDHTVTLNVELDAGVPLESVASRYHPISVTPQDEAAGRYHVTLTDRRTPMDHDLELVWRPVAADFPRAALFGEFRNGDPYFLLMLLPPDDLAGSQDSPVRLPRDLVLVVDTSGSMYGTSIEQARAALLLALQGLTPQDRFNVIQFNSVTKALFDSSVAATGANIETARRYVRALTAQGGTEMRPALERALRPGDVDEHLRQVIFITDGSVGNEAELTSLIRARLGDSRLFTVGIGSAPNSMFMRKVAEAGRGSFTFISALHETKEKMGALFAMLERPQVTGIEVAWPGMPTAYPRIVPDLYAGEPVVQKARLSVAPRPGDLVTVSGSSPAGDWRLQLPLSATLDHAGIGAVWARSRIEALLDGETNAEDARAEVIETALAHHLVSRYTSLVVVDKTPARPASAALDLEQVPNLLPYGQSQRAIFGFPATAAGWVVPAGAGLLLLLAAFLALIFRPIPADSHVTPLEGLLTFTRSPQCSPKCPQARREE